MTFRAVLLGFALGIAVSVLTFFNDRVILQTYMIGNHLPISVFGTLVALVFIVNPLLRKIRIIKPLFPAEIALSIAIALASCGWAGSSFCRLFVGMVSLPGHYYGNEAGWQAAKANTYVPGATAEVGEGHIRDYALLAKTVLADSGTPGAVGRMYAGLREREKQTFLAAAQGEGLARREKIEIVDVVNRCIGDTALFGAGVPAGVEIPREAARLLEVKKSSRGLEEHEHAFLNRHLMAASLPGVFLPMPEGSGLLLDKGRPDSEALTSLIEGWEGKGRMRLQDLPWRTWWPTIRFYGSLCVLFGLCMVFMVVIVQPQWKRELMPYPIATFVREITHCGEGKGVLPAIAGSRFFWGGFITIFVIHFINGLQAWRPEFINVQLWFNFSPLVSLLGPESWEIGPVILYPRVIPTVVAFMFFLRSDISFSAGISAFVWYGFHLIMLSNGVGLDCNRFYPRNFTMMHFGAHVGCAIMMLYIGRRYYLSVAARAVGIRRDAESPGLASWSLWGLVICSILFAGVLAGNGLDWVMAYALVACALLTMLVMSRINAETGLFFQQQMWLPIAALTGVFGLQAMGPTVIYIIAIISFLLCGDLRTGLMPFLVNSLHMTTDRRRSLPATRVVFFIILAVVVSFAASVAATVYFQYAHGYSFSDGWLASMSRFPMNMVTTTVSELSASDELVPSLEVNGLGRLSAIRPNTPMLGWAASGMALVMLCTFLRTRYVWWPLHPVFFLIWGSFHPCRTFGFSILLGWIIKTMVVRLSGAKGYHTVKPLMVGVISGELLAGLLWMVFAGVYFLITGLIPKSYPIFPG